MTGSGPAKEEEGSPWGRSREGARRLAQAVLEEAARPGIWPVREVGRAGVPIAQVPGPWPAGPATRCSGRDSMQRSVAGSVNRSTPPWTRLPPNESQVGPHLACRAAPPALIRNEGLSVPRTSAVPHSL